MEVCNTVNTLLKKYRLLLALTTGFLVLALQCSSASSAFARSIAPGGVAHPNVALSTPACDDLAKHDSCSWGGNFATGARGTYTEVSVEFKIPTISGPPDASVAFWAGLGGLPGTSSELVQAGVASCIGATTANNCSQTAGQHNSTFWSYTDANNKTTSGPFGFTQGLNPGDTIFVFVQSNYRGSGDDYFYMQNERTGEIRDHTLSGDSSDGASGECIGERPEAVQGGTQPPLAGFGTEEITDCQVSSNTITHAVGSGNGWPSDWSHIVNTSLVLLEGVGATDSSGSFSLNWKKAQ